MKLTSLFREIDLSKLIQNKYCELKKQISKFTDDEIMANDLHILAENCSEEFKIEPVNIEEKILNKSIDQTKIRKRITDFYNSSGRDYVDVDGVCFKFDFAFIGDEVLFKCQASTYSLSPYPIVEIFNHHITFAYEKTLQEMQKEDIKETILRALENDLKSVKSGIEYANKDVEEYNNNIYNFTMNELKNRKSKIQQFYDISKMFEIPLNKTKYAETYIPLQRKKIPIAQKYNQVEKIYCISNADYNSILDIIKHNGSTYERTPSSYKTLQEEDLRNTLLASLNAMYQGGVMGEAFRNHGKTDVCIEMENRAAFVAECKMWKGASKIAEAINQLDGYLTWRDCKTALIYFVRNKNFLDVLSKAEESLRKQENIREFQLKDRNEFDCSFISETNPGQLIRMRVMLFNLFVE